jgi:hypothetical protein
MSFCISVVLCMSSAEQSDDGNYALGERVNEWLEQHDVAAMLDVSHSFGGYQSPDMIVMGGGFGYFPDEEFADFVLALPWENPGRVVLIIQPDQGETRVFRPTSNSQIRTEE